MNNPYSLEGKVILITGSSSGIGAATAIECAKNGASVIVTGRNEVRLNKVLSVLPGIGHKSILADFSTEDGVELLADSVTSLDGLVCNAGFTVTLPVQFINKKSLQSIFDINTFAPILLLQKLLKRRKILPASSIVFTSSMNGVGPVVVGNSIYSASKGAISTFVRNAALELAGRGIRVNAVCPGMVNTGILEKNPMISQAQLDEDVKNYPLRRYGKPEDVAYLVIYLLSNASSWMTGNNIVIDGGYSIK